MSKNVTIKAVLLVLLGGIMGAASKAADVISTGSLFKALFWSFGLLTSGFLIWCVIGYFIASRASSLKNALTYNSCFFLAMLTAYYLYSYFVVKYTNIKVIFFWIIMTAAVLLATFLIRRLRTSKFFKRLSILVSTAFAALDVVFIQGFDLAAMIMEVFLLVVMLLLIKMNSLKKHKKL